jgi:endonuclease/exonuclease/phosphatase family metal-dependent hydrolase
MMLGIEFLKNTSLPHFFLHNFKNRKRGGSHDEPVPERAKDDPLLIASYNIHKCVGRDGRFDPERISRVIKEIDADVIGLQEADSRFGERKGLLDLNLLERESGLTAVKLDGSNKAHGWHGNVLLFREGLVRDVHPVKLPGLEPRGALVTELDLKRGGQVRIIAAHFGLLRHSRSQQAKRLVELLSERDDCPTIVLGDLNEWRIGRKSSLSSFRDAFGSLPDPVASFPSNLPVLPLDRIIASHKGLIGPVCVHDSPLARIASDHLPIKAPIFENYMRNSA